MRRGFSQRYASEEGASKRRKHRNYEEGTSEEERQWTQGWVRNPSSPPMGWWSLSSGQTVVWFEARRKSGWSNQLWLRNRISRWQERYSRVLRLGQWDRTWEWCSAYLQEVHAPLAKSAIASRIKGWTSLARVREERCRDGQVSFPCLQRDGFSRFALPRIIYSFTFELTWPLIART